jgi:hypothetical protein
MLNLKQKSCMAMRIVTRIAIRITSSKTKANRVRMMLLKDKQFTRSTSWWHKAMRGSNFKPNLISHL